MTDSQMWAYIAGFTDGEGNIAMGGSRGMRPNIQIGQSGDVGKKILTTLSEFMSLHGISAPVYKRKGIGGGVVDKRSGKSYQDAWVIVIFRKQDALKFLIAILPYLQVKRVLAQNLLRFFTLYPDWASFSRRKTHCSNGHPLTPENVFTDTLPGRKYGRRRCKTCHRKYMVTYEQKRKEAACRPL